MMLGGSWAYNSPTGDLTTQIISQARYGGATFYTRNDLIGGTDQNWTGGGVFGFSNGDNIFEVGYESYTGRGPDNLGRESNRTYYAQNSFERSFNQGIACMRYNSNFMQQNILSRSGWAQNWIHTELAPHYLFWLPGFSRTPIAKFHYP